MDKIQSQKKNLTIRRFFCYLVLIILVILSLFPFYIMIVNSTRSHMQIQAGFSALPGKYFFKNFVNLSFNKKSASPIIQNIIAKQNFEKIANYAENYPVLRGMLNSLIIATLSALVTTYFSAMTSYGIYMYNFKGKKFCFRFILAIMMVPTQVSTLGFLRLIGKLHMQNYLALIVPGIAAPVVFFYMYQSMEATLPFSIVEAARVDGCHEFKTFNRIVIPMMKPALAVQAIFSFVGSWNNYFIPALVINDKVNWTVPIVIANARNADYLNFDQAINYMLMILAIIPLMIVYLCLSRYIISGVTAGGVKE
ncbi:MAG: carbohydrate ABC transporter permease [Treponema sp.]|nr:carbohydrate ABC transporter permease [Treponema sp.]